MNALQTAAFANAFTRADGVPSDQFRSLRGGWKVGLSVNK